MPKTCYNCGNRGHLAKHCPRKVNNIAELNDDKFLTSEETRITTYDTNNKRERFTGIQ